MPREMFFGTGFSGNLVEYRRFKDAAEKAASIRDQTEDWSSSPKASANC
jgi:hypothetical protein